MSRFPSYDHLMQPVFQAIKELGGFGSIDEIDDKVAELLGLSEEIINQPHNP